MNKHVCLILLALSFIITATTLPRSHAYAAGVGAIAYSRTDIGIIRKTVPPPPEPFPWLDEPPPHPENPVVNFDVEVRDGMTFYRQQGWFNLNDLGGRNGILMLFSSPTPTPIRHQEQYAPIDIILADKEGVITQIVPNIQLSELDQEIMPAKPALALLLLKGGTCAARSINPGDKIDSGLFKKSPTIILNSPRKASSATLVIKP